MMNDTDRVDRIEVYSSGGTKDVKASGDFTPVIVSWEKHEVRLDGEVVFTSREKYEAHMFAAELGEKLRYNDPPPTMKG